MFGFPTSKYVNAPKKVSWRNSLEPTGSILQKLFHGCRDVARLGKDDVLQFGLVRAEGIHGRNALDRRIQLLEKFVRDTRRDLCAIAPAQHVFVSHDHPVRLSNGRRNGLPIVGRERTQVDNFNRDSFAFQLRRRDFRALPNGIVKSGPGFSERLYGWR